MNRSPGLIAQRVARILRWGAGGCVLAVIVAYAAAAIGSLSPSPPSQSESAALELVASHPVIFGVLALAISPLLEELVYRAVIYRCIAAVMDRPTAFTVATFVFIAAHEPSAAGTFARIAHCAYLTAAYQQGGYWAAVAGHAGINLVPFVLLTWPT